MSILLPLISSKKLINQCTFLINSCWHYQLLAKIIQSQECF